MILWVIAKGSMSRLGRNFIMIRIQKVSCYICMKALSRLLVISNHVQQAQGEKLYKLARMFREGNHYISRVL